jgi:hypothetical protein
VIAPRPRPPDTARDLVTCVDRTLPELLTEHADLAGRGVERSAVLGLAGGDGGTQVVGRAAGERRPAASDRIDRMGVAVPDVGKSVVVGEPHDTIVPRSSECRRVERLDGIRPNGVVGIVE